jgi:tRNA A-37 threonylcarbamoyl transferase component Bud32
VARSYLLVEFVAGAESLDRLLRRLPAGAASRLAVARRLGRLIGRIHGAGFRARDLKAPNFLVGPGGRVWLVDLDGVSRESSRHVRRRRGRDLARLVRDVVAAGALDPEERRAFVRGYRRGVSQTEAATGKGPAG